MYTIDNKWRFEDTIGIIRRRKAMKYRQYTSEKKQRKKTT